jgi:transposase
VISKDTIESVAQKYRYLQSEFNERTTRLWAAAEAIVIGHGGVLSVYRATGLSESTIRLGKRELENKQEKLKETASRIRKRGGGRKAITYHDEELLQEIELMVEPTTRGDPMSPLRWTCKSTRKLAKELKVRGHEVSHSTVAQLLKDLGYSLQGTCKTKEGNSHPDRNAQFEYINQQVKDFQQFEQPVISVDTKKKELVGDFTNGGREYQPKGKPEKVRTYDFIDKDLGKAIPYGVYDVTNNEGWVSVGTDHDTSQFAVETIRRWWFQMGEKSYPNAKKLLITADGGGSNGSRTRSWKVELQSLADTTRLTISVCHFPPCTSKWNKIEHRMFCHITKNWRGRPLIDHEVIVNLIANTTTEEGLRIQAELDTSHYPTGLKVSKEQMMEVKIEPANFHGNDWNYTIHPKQ